MAKGKGHGYLSAGMRSCVSVCVCVCINRTMVGCHRIILFVHLLFAYVCILYELLCIYNIQTHKHVYIHILFIHMPYGPPYTVNHINIIDIIWGAMPRHKFSNYVK